MAASEEAEAAAAAAAAAATAAAQVALPPPAAPVAEGVSGGDDVAALERRALAAEASVAKLRGEIEELRDGIAQRDSHLAHVFFESRRAARAAAAVHEKLRLWEEAGAAEEEERGEGDESAEDALRRQNARVLILQEFIQAGDEGASRLRQAFAASAYHEVLLHIAGQVEAHWAPPPVRDLAAETAAVADLASRLVRGGAGAAQATADGGGRAPSTGAALGGSTGSMAASGNGGAEGGMAGPTAAAAAAGSGGGVDGSGAGDATGSDGGVASNPGAGSEGSAAPPPTPAAPSARATLAGLAKKARLNTAREVALASTPVAESEVVALGESLRVSSTVHRVALVRCFLPEVGVFALAREGLANNRRLHSLTLDACRLTPAAAIAVLDAVATSGVANLALGRNLLCQQERRAREVAATTAASQDPISGSGGGGGGETQQKGRATKTGGENVSDSVAEGDDGAEDEHEEESGVCAALARCLSTSLSLRRLDVAQNGLNAAGVEQVCAAAGVVARAGTLQLVHLDLSGNHLGAEGAATVGKFLATPNLKLQSLSLWGCFIGAAGGASLARGLRWNSTLARLSLRGNNLRAAGAAALATALDKTPSALPIPASLDDDDVDDDEDENAATEAASLGGASDAKDGRVSQCAIQVLDLAGNDFGPEGARALSAGLLGNACLQELDLAMNGLGDAGCASICAVPYGAKDEEDEETSAEDRLAGDDGRPRPPPALRTLLLPLNNIGEGGARAVAHMLSQPECSLTHLDLTDNGIPQSGFSEIARLLAQSSSGTSPLARVAIRGNPAEAANSTDNLVDIVPGRVPQAPAPPPVLAGV